MAEIVYMPKLSDTMTEGVVAAWNKKVGEEVKEGEILAEIETDKATMEFESFYDGVLLHIGVETGSTAPVNSVLAVIGAKDEDIAEILKNADTGEKPEETPAPVEENKVEVPAVDATPEPKKTDVPTPETVVPNSPSSNDKIFASPLAKKLAREKGIDLNTLQGSGDNGRIIKRDIEHYIPFTPAAPAAQFSAAPAGTESYRDETVSQMRKTIARRLADSKFTAHTSTSP